MWNDKTKMSADEIKNEIRSLKRLREVSLNLNVNQMLSGVDITNDLNVVNLQLTPSGIFFHKERGFLPEMMDRLYIERKKFKKLMIEAQQQREKETQGSDEYKRLSNDISKYDNIQMSRKISLNSAYGALGFKFFRWFDLRLAESITLAGQLSVRWIEKSFNKYFNNLLKTKDYDYVVAIDTDSNYLRMGKLVDKFFDKDIQQNDPNKIVRFLDTVCKDKLEPMITKSYEALATYTNAFEQKMFMNREAIANKGIWTAKKRYILNVFNNEGVQYKTPKKKIMGIESVRSSTPGVVRTYLEESFDIIIDKTEDEMIDYIAEKTKEFKSLPVEDIASPTSVNGLSKWYDKDTTWKLSCPKHVKGALVFNTNIAAKKLENKYQFIKSGDKCKTMPLKEPNNVFANVITFPEIVPKEFQIEKYFDYDEQWNKTFISPIRKILDVIGWEVERKASLDAFFTD